MKRIQINIPEELYFNIKSSKYKYEQLLRSGFDNLVTEKNTVIELLQPIIARLSELEKKHEITTAGLKRSYNRLEIELLQIKNRRGGEE